ncbi:MAG: GntR family transcriptional regulator [Motiliproteus sp.]
MKRSQTQSLCLRRRPLHEEVAEHLRQLITDETLAEGSHIDETALCTSLDISRTPLREALKVLQAEGLVAIEPNRGAHVSIIHADELEQLFEVLAGIERQAAELCCLRADTSGLSRFLRLQKKMDLAYSADNRPGYFSACQQSHQLVIQLARNQVLTTTHGLLVARTRRTRFRAITSRQRWELSIQEHQNLTQALVHRDAHSAGDILARHVQGSGQAIVNHLRQQQNST